LPVDRHPTSIGLPKFGLPGYIDPDHPDRETLNVEGFGVMKPDGASLIQASRQYGAEEYVIRFPDPSDLARFVAKVGFGFAVACVGLRALVSPYVTNAILGHKSDAGRWVGNLDEAPRNANSGVHSVTLECRRNELWAHVRLFAQFGFPEYLVIVGSMVETCGERTPVGAVTSV
jgi:hypothetical protein